MNSIPYIKTPKELGLKTDSQGIYINTTDARLNALKVTGILEFGVGDTRLDGNSTIADRQITLSSSKNPAWQQHLLDTIPTPGYRDYALHAEIRESFAVQLKDPKTGKRSELFQAAIDKSLVDYFIKTNDFEPIREWTSKKIRECASKLNPNHKKQSVNLRNVQRDVIEKVIKTLRQNGIVTNFVCELAARIGKTILFLELACAMNKEFGHEAMFIMAYGVGLSVKTSYKNECSKFSDFSNMSFIDAADADAEKQYRATIKAGNMPVVFVSLNPEAEEKYIWINKLSGNYIALLEETDFGTHTESQVEKVEYILENKTATRINASGTNIGRLAKAFGQNAIDEIISVPYCMVEQDSSIPDVVTRRFYNMLFNARINKLLEDFDRDVLPNITKILSKPYSQQKFISALFQDILGYQPIYGFNISDCAGEEILHSMLFVNISKEAMDQLAEVIEKACLDHKVLILNGDYTDNKEAEGLTKEELVRLKNDHYTGRNKLLVITNMMGTRSYSIPEIQACLFMQEGGDVYPYMQKYSRCLTPGFNKKYGHIFDFSFDQSKTRNTIMSVAVEAALLIRQKGKTYPEAVREVLNSVNIKDMVTGQWIDGDQVIKQFEDNNKLLEIANAHTRITIEDLTAEEIEAFGELAKRSSNSKQDKSKIDKIVETGKTFESQGSATKNLKKNPLKAVVEKAIRMINGSATTVLALSNYQGESFLECVDIIENNAKMSAEFVELYGVGADTIKRLSNRLEISTLDMIVRMSKYNTTQKHIENNSLAILKDDPKLWFEIFGNRELKRFIKSKDCKKILVVAGGHGSEIDVLVDMFGIEITKKIVYNDKYTFLCNQIKRNYPDVTVAQGDFIKMEFDMKFDVIVGNPPYQKTAEHGKKVNDNLWAPFTFKSWDLLNDDGILAFITPDNWRTPTNDFRTEGKSILKEIIKPHNTIAINLNEAERHFDVGSTISYFVVQKTINNTNVTSLTSPWGKDTIDLNVLPTVPKDLSSHGLSIFSKIISSPGKRWNFNQKQTKLNKSLDIVETQDKNHTVQLFDSFGGKDIKFCDKKGEDHSSPKAMITYVGKYTVMVDDGNITPAQHVHRQILELNELDGAKTQLESKLYRFIIDGNRANQYIEKHIPNMMPQLDLTKSWTDQDVYQYFGLTREEIDYVESQFN